MRVLDQLLISLTILICLTANACARPQSAASPLQATPSQSESVRQFSDPSKFALIITGASGEEEFAKLFAKWSTDLRSTLINKLGFASENVTLLSETSEPAKATATEVRKVFTALRTNCKPEHSVFIFFIGHGSFDGKEAKFNLVGPDITAGEYGAMIKALPAQRVVVVNTASASGEFVKPLSGAGHVIVTATRSGQETNATHFPEYFIAALGAREADADQNQRISVQEALDYARLQTERFYKEQNRLVTEHSLLDDNGDSKGSEKADQGDGSLARNTFFDSLPLQLAGGNPELRDLYAERLRLESEVEHLKARKAGMKADDYDNELEKLLLQLAELHEKISRKQK